MAVFLVYNKATEIHTLHFSKHLKCFIFHVINIKWKSSCDHIKSSWIYNAPQLRKESNITFINLKKYAIHTWEFIEDVYARGNFLQFFKNISALSNCRHFLPSMLMKAGPLAFLRVSLGRVYVCKSFTAAWFQFFITLHGLHSHFRFSKLVKVYL